MVLLTLETLTKVSLCTRLMDVPAEPLCNEDKPIFPPRVRDHYVSAALSTRAWPNMTTLFSEATPGNFGVRGTTFVCPNLDTNRQIAAHLLMHSTMWKKSGPRLLGENLCNPSGFSFS